MTDVQTIDERVAQARHELAATLDAIEDRFNVRKQAIRLTVLAKESYRRNPTPWVIGGLIAAAGIVTAVTVAIVKRS